MPPSTFDARCQAPHPSLALTPAARALLQVPPRPGLLIFQAHIVDQPILDRIDTYQQAGGKVIALSGAPIVNVEGKPWPGASQLTHVAPFGLKRTWLSELSGQVADYRGVDGKLDDLWTCRCGSQVFVFNSTAKPVETMLDGQSATVAPYTVWCNHPAHPGG